MVQGNQKVHVLPPNCFFQLGDDISVGPHPGCIPFGKSRIPQRKTVVVFTYWPGEFGASFPEQLSPFVGIELFGGKHRDKIFITELRWMSKGFTVIFKLW